METTFKLKDQFFDRDLVKASLDVVKHKAFHIAAATVRKTAMQSMRRQKKATPPGRPPAYHDSNVMTLRYILYGWDPQRKSIIVGPTKHPSSKNPVSVPSLHEFGKVAPVEEWKLIPSDKKTKTRIAKNKKLASQFNVWLNGGSKTVKLPKHLQYTVVDRVRMVKYPKRPFMRPALEKTRARLPHLFKGMLRPLRKARR